MSDRRVSDDLVSGGDKQDDEFELTEEQKASLDLDRNVAITAGAGTGKTTTLEERYRHILETEPTVDPTNVVTITFTRDATAALRDGIREVIDEQLASADADEYDRWRRAKDTVEDAYVHTIHGFCSRILREYAVEADVHPDFETLDETDAAVLATRVAREVVMAALGEGGDVDSHSISAEGADAIADDVRRLARLYDRDELVSLFRGLLSERPESDTWADSLRGKTEPEYVEEVIARASPIDGDEADALAARDDVREALTTIEELAGREFAFTAADDNGCATLDRIGAALPTDGVAACSTADRQKLFLEICDVVTSNDGSVYSRAHYYAGSSTRWGKHGLEADNETLQDACQTLIDALDPESRDLDVTLEAAATSASYVFAIARLYRVICDEYDERKASRNALDYADLIERAVDFLETHDRARRELRDQFAYVMVDEVQDTDPRQWDLVRLLTGTDAPEFDGQNVFLVGDEKQSIYRFRGADVTMVRRTRDQLAAANPDGVDPDEELSGNFRTLPETLGFINDCFDRVFEPQDPDAGYRPYVAEPQRLTAERPAGTDIEGTVEYLVTPEREADVSALGLDGSWFDERTFDSAAEREAASVAARLTRLFADPPTVYDEEADVGGDGDGDDDAVGYRPAEPRDVAILFRTRSRLRTFERALEECDIPYTSVGGQSLYEAPEITPLVNLLSVLQNPERDVPLYGVLRSPLFGFTDDELAGLYHPTESLWERLCVADGRLASAAERLSAWRESCGVDGGGRSTKWGAFVSRVVDETGYLVAIGADERPTQAVVNVNQFRERLRGWEEGSALPLADVLVRIERERDFGDDVGEAQIPTDVEGVQLRTVHSAKGLEFPIVVVPELGRGAGGQATISTDGGRFSKDLAYLEVVDGEPVLGISAPDPTAPLETTKTPDWTLAAGVQDREGRAEAKRVLYVAMTRVRDHLVLSSTHRIEADGEEAFGPVSDGADASCWRDWVQPALLEGRGILETLRTTGVVECELGDSSYRVRRPTEPVAGPGSATPDEVEHTIEIPSPESYPTKTPLSATAFRDLAVSQSRLSETGSDSGEMVPESTEARHEQPETGPVSDAAAVDHEPFFETLDSDDGLEGSAFGTLVHRLCELGLSGVEIDWAVDPYRVVDDPDRLTAADIDRAREHVRSGLGHVESLEAELDVIATYDELPVTLELETGRIVGDVDHLTVTEDRYVVTDYKTDSLGGKRVEELAETYWPQLRIYACALQQARPKEAVELRLVFTDGDEVRTERMRADDVDRFRNRSNEILAMHLR